MAQYILVRSLVGEIASFGRVVPGKILASCKSSSQTGILHLSKDLDSQCMAMSECLSGSSVDQAVKVGNCKVLSLDSSTTPAWHGNVIQDVPYLMKDPITVRECDYYPSRYKELGNGYIFSLGMKKPNLLGELRRGATFDKTLSHEPGRCGDSKVDLFQHPHTLKKLNITHP